MARNILIFSDGTGQAGGRTPDQDISNVYKLYRATRCDTDSTVDACKQIAFYDAGLGTDPEGLNFFGRHYRRALNLAGSALGLGINRNIVDCYAALIRTWSPGDRIYLIGFSRGAFTVRCLAAALALCGLPTKAKGEMPLRRDRKSVEAIARRAVRIYQTGAGHTEGAAADKRKRLAAEFRRDHHSFDEANPNAGNSVPYFIGVFDTVATIANMSSLAIILLPLVLLAVAAYYIRTISIASVSIGVILLAIQIFSVYLFVQSWRGKDNWRVRFSKRWIRPFKFYDYQLDKRVSYARHAVSIDENRSDFQVLLWDEDNETYEKKNDVRRLKQVWFAGVHSDIGGSYPESESRLSDIALQWMVEELQGLPEAERPLFAEGRLHTFPDPLGMQHDELKAIRGWFYGPRPNVKERGAVHDSVGKRLKASAVLQYDEMKVYRPSGLKGHQDFPDIVWDQSNNKVEEAIT